MTAAFSTRVLEQQKQRQAMNRFYPAPDHPDWEEYLRFLNYWDKARGDINKRSQWGGWLAHAKYIKAKP